ncbi:MAG: TonB-dependent receptor [Asticcacaulis sp.]
MTAFRSSRKGAKSTFLALLASVSYGAIQTAPAFANDVADAAVSSADNDITEVYITARRRSENVQTVPIAVSVVGGEQLDRQGINNVDQLQRSQPSVQLITSNARNTATTIRGLGSTIGLTNDGLEQGVGIYVDEVFYARPGSALIDLIDIDRIEVLRGPQGTLFGKNTTAGAISISTRAPTFSPEGRAELSVGDYGFVQAKGAISGPLINGKLAGRLSFGATRRDGLFKNVTTGTKQNDQNSQVLRAQLLFTPSDALKVRLSYDFALSDPEANTQAFVRYGPTLRAENRQFPYLADYYNYQPASTNPYDRLVDVNDIIQAKQRINGLSGTVNWDLGSTTFTSITAFRKWEWWPQNDRDYTSLSIRTKSSNPSEQHQYSQEFRLASNGERTIDWVVGLYAFTQRVETNGTEAWGFHATRWYNADTSLPENLLDGYTQSIHAVSKTKSYAAFGQLVWNVSERLKVTAGLRYTHEEKEQIYDQVASGGLETTNPAHISAKNAISRTYFYQAELSDGSPSGLLSASYNFTPNVLGYVSVSKGYKSGGINAAGIPTDTSGNPVIQSAVLDPEEVTSLEAGLKTQFWDKRGTLNFAAYTSQIKDYQANVVDSGTGSLRGYLANVDKVEVKGIEVDGRLRATDNLHLYGAVSYTDAEYASFANAPAPLELQSSGTSIADLSGTPLPGVSKWAGSLGGEYSFSAPFNSLQGQAYISADATYRSSWNSDASVSKYAEIDASTVVNLRLGYRASEGTEVFIYVKNVFDEEYLKFLSIQQGNSGAIFGDPGDPRFVGITLRKAF